jgi:hypothetical protein
MIVGLSAQVGVQREVTDLTIQWHLERRLAGLRRCFRH